MEDACPLVTIALFAYNHEKYVEEAIDAALTQEYPRLEIILSDDRSTDKTFEIIQRRVAEYRGPHLIRARQSLSNGGTLRHVLDVARESKGEFLVLATGDDIQLPGRTRLLADAWKHSDAAAFSSPWHEIDHAGSLITEHVRPEAKGNLVWQYFRDKKDRRFMSGPTAAYDASFLKSLPIPNGKIFHEDTVFTFILHALDSGIHYVDTPTAAYRIHGASYSNRTFSGSSIDQVKERELATAAYAKATAAYLEYLLYQFLPPVLADSPDVASRIDLDFMHTHLRRSALEGSWIESTAFERLRALLGARDMHEAAVMIPRLTGLNALAALKALRGS